MPDIKLRGEEFSASLSEEEYLDKKRLKRENKKLEIERFTLAFTPRDVKYIIVRSENEIGRMVYTINNLIVPASARSYLKVLTTRIISVEQIKEDF